MKGIILAGGKATRLYPLTFDINKHLLPCYDKPMIYYSLSVLMQANIRDILIVSTIDDLPLFEKLLGDGKRIGLNITYLSQKNPNGIAEVFMIGKDFIKNDDVCLILGDNIIYSPFIKVDLSKAIENLKLNKCTIFAYQVSNPKRYGICNFDNDKLIEIEEKPSIPKSNYAVIGLYFFKKSVCCMASKLKPSIRGELEITDLNNLYINNNEMEVIKLDNNYSWFDAGTIDSLKDVGDFIYSLEKQQKKIIPCIEEIALCNKWINKKIVKETAKTMSNTFYGKYLLNIIGEENGDN